MSSALTPRDETLAKICPHHWVEVAYHLSWIMRGCRICGAFQCEQVAAPRGEAHSNPAVGERR